MIPPGFEETRIDGARVWARPGAAASVMALTDPARGHAPRGSVRFATLGIEGREIAVAIRHYHRGGILGPLLGDVHRDGLRPLRELSLLAAARAAGVPTLEPVAGVARPAGGSLWRLDLVTRAVAGARDLGALAGDALVLPRRRRRVIQVAARAVRALHEAGLYHVDLNLKNILVREDGDACEALVIDLDGAERRGAPLPAADRDRNLLRLYRSAVKLAGKAGRAPPPRADLVRFLRAYFGADEGAFREAARRPLPKFRARRWLW